MANLALVAISGAYGVVQRAEDALVSAGHAVTIIADSGITTADFSSYDAIVTTRTVYTSRATIGATLRAEVDAGKPVLVGMVEHGFGSVNGELHQGVPYEMRLLAETVTYAFNLNGSQIDIIDTSHEITDSHSLGAYGIYTGSETGTLRNGSAAFVGDVLANGDPAATDPAGKALLIAIEQGTNDLDGVPTGARVVLYGGLFPDRSTVSAGGVTLIGEILDWLLATPVVPTVELAARLVMGIDQRGDINIPTGVELAARLVFAVDTRPQLNVGRYLAARLVFGIDQRSDIQVGAPGQQLAARLVFGLDLRPEVTVTRTLAARLVFAVDTTAALLITRQLSARLVMGVDLREGYVGPGTGLVVSGVLDPLSVLREGDTFNVFLPWAGLTGMSGLAHVISRRVTDEREDQELELSIIPNDAANVPQMAGGSVPTPTADSTDLARKQSKQAREIDKLERTRTKR